MSLREKTLFKYTLEFSSYFDLPFPQSCWYTRSKWQNALSAHLCHLRGQSVSRHPNPAWFYLENQMDGMGR